jgi:hypothetical protein
MKCVYATQLADCRTCSQRHSRLCLTAGTAAHSTHLVQVVQQQQAWVGIGEDHAASCSDFLQQLGYREYSRYLSFHFPFITERSLLAHLRAVPWRLDVGAFKVRQGGVACLVTGRCGHGPCFWSHLVGFQHTVLYEYVSREHQQLGSPSQRMQPCSSCRSAICYAVV